MMPATVELIESATGLPVAATLMPSLTTAEMDPAEADWAPERAALLGIEHSQWDWRRKARSMTAHGGWCLGLSWAGRV